MKFVPALDGVRGLAILGVLLFHFGYAGSGWAGVQLFFVLSGFLITSILRSETSLRFVSYIKRFYWRRTLRIFPLYFAFLLVFVAIFAVVGPTDAFRQQWPYLFTYTFNFVRVLDRYIYPNYWGHFWSLSVEEQFYLIWPAFIYFMPSRWFNRIMIILALGTPVLRMLIGQYLIAQGTANDQVGNIIYNLTFCQLDAFALGALVSASNASERSAHQRFALATVVLLGAGLWNQWSLRPIEFDAWTFGYPMNTPYNFQFVWGYSLLNLWSAALIGAALHPGLLSRLLEFQPLVYTGKISYGLYVYHLTVRTLLWTYAPYLFQGRRAVTFSVYLALTYFIAHLSFHFFEKRFLNLKDKFAPPRVSDSPSR